jgi:hypothetical protein
LAHIDESQLAPEEEGPGRKAGENEAPRQIYISDYLKQPIAKDSRVLAFYDPDTCTYVALGTEKHPTPYVSDIRFSNANPPSLSPPPGADINGDGNVDINIDINLKHMHVYKGLYWGDGTGPKLCSIGQESIMVPGGTPTGCTGPEDSETGNGEWTNEDSQSDRDYSDSAAQPGGDGHQRVEAGGGGTVIREDDPRNSAVGDYIEGLAAESAGDATIEARATDGLTDGAGEFCPSGPAGVPMNESAVNEATDWNPQGTRSPRTDSPPEMIVTPIGGDHGESTWESDELGSQPGWQEGRHTPGIFYGGSDGVTEALTAWCSLDPKNYVWACNSDNPNHNEVARDPHFDQYNLQLSDGNNFNNGYDENTVNAMSHGQTGRGPNPDYEGRAVANIIDFGLAKKMRNGSI